MENEKKRIPCNICGLPGKVRYKEQDSDTGEIKWKEHEVKCLGHTGIHPAAWYKHKEYDKYRKFYAKLSQQETKHSGREAN